MAARPVVGGFPLGLIELVEDFIDQPNRMIGGMTSLSAVGIRTSCPRGISASCQ